jgi:hypothetical protein
MDTLFSWDLLKNGGILIFDDYKWDYALPMEMRPTFALDVFLILFQDEFEVLIKDYQLIIRKTKKYCNEDLGIIKKGDISLVCSYIGQYVYYWKPQKLFDVSNNREFILSRQEIPMIENTLINRNLSLRLELEKQQINEYQKLMTKLKLSNISLSPKEK